MPNGAGGGGGGGIVGVGNTFTGPAEALEVYGDHAYAYSGVKSINNATATFLEFTTGNYYFVGTIMGGRNMKSTAESTIIIYFNGGIVYQAKFDNGASQTLVIPFSAPGHLIIPAYTVVKVELEVNDAPDNLSLALTGRIYRG